jgi:hypothetical protein
MIQTATTVYTIEEVILQDENVAVLKPLPIKQLRKFMTELEKLGKTENEEDGVDIMTTMAGICLQKQLPDLVSDRDALEDALDMPTIYKIVEVCGGVKLNDPKLLEMAQQMALQGGQTST